MAKMRSDTWPTWRTRSISLSPVRGHEASKLELTKDADVHMPVMDGYELLRHIRILPSTTLIPLILFSAVEGVDENAKAFNAGADDFLVCLVAARRENVLTYLVDQTFHFSRSSQPGQTSTPCWWHATRP